MGYIKKEWIICSFLLEPKVIIDYINNIEENYGCKRFFYINSDKINGYCTIFMDWDGSKEGWEESDFFDVIREEFLKRVKEYIKTNSLGGKIIYICDDEYKFKPCMKLIK